MNRQKPWTAARRGPIATALLLTASVMATHANAGETLRSYNADIHQTTVSGLSAGGFFATQFHVAHSQHIKGMANIAGGPYFCAEGSLNKAYNAKQGDLGYGMYSGQCMGGNFNGVNAAQMSINEAQQEASAGRIDPLTHLTTSKVFIFGGSVDPTVVPAVVAQNKPFYTGLQVPEANIRLETSIADGHAMPMRDSRSWANECGARNATYGYASVSPWMSNCNYDTAGVLLGHFYGALNPRVPSEQLRGRFVQFDQTEFTRQAGARYLNTEGFMYVPPSCEAGERCRVHVAFHGCHQVWDRPAGDYGANMGDKFYRYAGYNEWAENNRIIVLYPQAQKTAGVNPRGCFDWWGYEDAGNQNGPCNTVGKYTYGQCSAARYHTKDGVQIKAVWSMVQRVTAGSTGGNPSSPVINSVNATNDASCSTITANVSDPDNDLARVEVRVNNGSPEQASSVGGGNWTYRACPGTGTHTATVIAYDAKSNASGPQTVSFTIGGSNGGGLTPGSGTWVEESSLFGLQNAQVYVPRNPSPAVRNGKRALMLSLHGCAQSSGDVINKRYNWEPVAEQNGMVVIAPTTPATGREVLAVRNCWNWAGTNHTRGANDVAKLLQLVEAVRQRPELSIDPKQIYVSGLSAGSAEAHVLACIAPEVFAGVGLASGPALGNSYNVLFGALPERTASAVAATCRQLAGSNTASLDTQIASVIVATVDGTVNPAHSRVNIDGMKIVYGANTSGGNFSLPGGGSGTIWNDASNRQRVTEVSVQGLGHAWSAGPGGAQNSNYVSNQHVNYPEYLTKYLFDHNIRVGSGGNANPVLSCSPISLSGTTATLSCSATDNGSIASYRVQRSGPTSGTDTIPGAPNFSRQYTGLPNGHYTFEVTATDNEGLSSNPVRLEFDVGSTGGNQAPVIASIAASASGNCVNVSGSASDADGQVTSVEIRLNGASQGNATGTTSFSRQVCNLSAGSYTASAIAVDNRGARSSERSAAPVTVQPAAQGVTATVVQHYTAGRITLQQYLEMGQRLGWNTPVTLYQCGNTWSESATCN
jgi:poly(3-hydroxybutyrate) depolymerase